MMQSLFRLRTLALLATLVCAPLAGCQDDSPSNVGGQAAGGAGEGGAGGEVSDTLNLASCAGEAAALGDPLALPAIDWAADDGIAQATCALRALDAAIEPARVICLGENAHGVSQSSRWHSVVSRYLIHRWNVRTIAHELPGASSDAWGRFVATGEPAELENGFADSAGSLADSVELERLVQAFRDVQLELGEGQTIAITGFDVAVQDKSTRASLVAYLEQANPSGAAAHESALTTGDYLERADAADAIANEIDDNADAYAALTDAVSTRLARRDALNLADGYRFLDRYSAGDFWVGNKRYREPGMIRNIGSLIAELPADERLLLISHNGHCGRDMSASGIPAQAATWPAFGTHYATELGAAYFVLGQVYGGGTQLMIGGTEEPIDVAIDSLEELLNGAIEGPASLFATSTDAFDLSQSYDMENMSAVVPSEQFDALLYLRAVEPITLR